MQPTYIQLVGTTVKVQALDTNKHTFSVNIRLPASCTVLGCLEDPGDILQPNTSTAPVTTQAPVWSALPAAVNGIITLNATTGPYSALQFTPTTGGIVTLLQNGIE